MKNIEFTKNKTAENNMKSVNVFPSDDNRKLSFPIDEKMPLLFKTLGNKKLPKESRRYIIISAPTGTGKTLGIPLALARKLKKSLIRVSVPTTIAARKAYAFVKQKTNITTGFAAGRERNYGNADRVVYMTAGYMVAKIEGILKETRDKNVLSRRLRPVIGDILMIDEVHTGTVDITILLGLMRFLKDIVSTVVLISSATGAGEALDFFPLASQVSFPSKSYPVEKIFVNIDTLSAKDKAINSEIVKICRDERKNGAKVGIVFRPGKKEVRETILALVDGLNRRGLKVLPAVSGISREEQEEIDEPVSGDDGFKVIVGTNFIESSVTIKDTDFIITDMLEKSVFKTPFGEKKLVTQHISKASAKQRIGRAGRTKEGKAYILMSENVYELLPEFREPEILRVPIDEVVLNMIDANLDTLEIVNIPERDYLVSKDKLSSLGMLEGENDETVTPKGTFASRMGISVRGSSMIFSSLEILKERKTIESFMLTKFTAALAVMIESYGNGYFFSPFRKADETPEQYDEKTENSKRMKEPLLRENDIATLVNMFANWMDFRALTFLNGKTPLAKISIEWTNTYSVNNVRWKDMLMLFTVVNKRIYDYSSFYQLIDNLSIPVPNSEQMESLLQRIYPLIRETYSDSKLVKKGFNYINPSSGVKYKLNRSKNNTSMVNPNTVYSLVSIQIKSLNLISLYLPGEGEEKEERIEEIGEEETIEEIGEEEKISREPVIEEPIEETDNTPEGIENPLITNEILSEEIIEDELNPRGGIKNALDEGRADEFLEYTDDFEDLQ